MAGSDVKSIQYEKQEWRETALKGRMAESLISDLLRECGNEVYRIGYEAILPGLARIEESFQRNSTVGEKIRTIPDFFVIDKSGMPHLVEVKFRWHPAGHESDPRKLEQIKQGWEETLVVFVNCTEKPYFRYCRFPFVDAEGHINSESLQSLESFGVSAELLSKFDLMVEKYFAPTLHHRK